MIQEYVYPLGDMSSATLDTQSHSKINTVASDPTPTGSQRDTLLRLRTLHRRTLKKTIFTLRHVIEEDNKAVFTRGHVLQNNKVDMFTWGGQIPESRDEDK
ncbi:hypothetical protein ElyMa_004531600 [Elysia marginata]|uniref:Uncharacterized protein n=1 Tax=Elysia marginata TaxID=1093978 RepID=A0AAV4HQU4_9GAST|nr:hypothetical protein ElyMa_004531600 [Elysia marginata]